MARQLGRSILAALAAAVLAASCPSEGPRSEEGGAAVAAGSAYGEPEVMKFRGGKSPLHAQFYVLPNAGEASVARAQ